MQPGAVIGGKYRLTRKLGEGGMGEVWAAKNLLIERDVAIKLMLPALSKSQEAMKRFFGEARTCASIRHPGIVDTFDLGTAEDGAPFMVMELLEGEPLEGRMAGGLALSEALEVLRDVAQTLSLAHEKGIVHRDLKPANLFLHRGPTGGRVVKILDFGISKVLNEAASAYATRTGSILGSPAYMSPEQAGGKPIDARTDIYALGVILYECAAGSVPFHDAPNINALLVRIATEDPTPLTAVAPTVPASVAAIVARCMSRRSADRFSASELAEALERAARDPAVAGWIAPRIQRAVPVVSALDSGLPYVPVPEAPSLLGTSSPAGTPSALQGAPAAGVWMPSPPGAGNSAAITSAPTSVSQPQPVRGKTNPAVVLAIAAAIVAGVAAGAVLLVTTRSSHSASSSDPAAPTSVPSTTTTTTAVSPPPVSSVAVVSSPPPTASSPSTASEPETAAPTPLASGTTSSRRPTPALHAPSATPPPAPSHHPDDFK